MDKPLFEKLGAFIVNFKFTISKFYKKYHKALYVVCLIIVVGCIGFNLADTLIGSGAPRVAKVNSIKATINVQERKIGNYNLKFPEIIMPNKETEQKINAEIMKAVDKFQAFCISGPFGNLTIDGYKSLYNRYALVYQDDSFLSVMFYGAYHRVAYKWCWTFDKTTGDVVPLSRFYDLSLDDLKYTIRKGNAIVLSSSLELIPFKKDLNSISMVEFDVGSLKRVSNDYIYIGDKMVALQYQRYELVSGAYGEPYIVLGVDNYDDKTKSIIESTLGKF